MKTQFLGDIQSTDVVHYYSMLKNYNLMSVNPLINHVSLALFILLRRIKLLRHFITLGCP